MRMNFNRRTGRRPGSKRLVTLLAALTLTACAGFRPDAGTAPPDDYLVQPGDNIHSIAFALETTPQALLRANPGTDMARLAPGMRLAVPMASDDTLAGAAPAGSADDGSGNNAAPVRGSAYIWPLQRYEVSSRYGKRWGRFHRGIDLQAPRGAQVLAVAAGRVKFSGRSGAYGNRVVIEHGGGIETVYAHNLRNLVARGERVEQGQVIALVGRSGNASGYHLHFEFRRNGRALNPVGQIRVARE